MSPEEIVVNLEVGRDNGFIKRQLMKHVNKHKNDKRHIKKNKKSYYKTHVNLGDMAQGAPTNYKDKFGRIIKIGDTIFYNNLRWIANKFSELECPAGKIESVHMSDISPLDMEIINHKITSIMNAAPTNMEWQNNDNKEQVNSEENSLSIAADGQIHEEVTSRGFTYIVPESANGNDNIDEVKEHDIENLLDKIEDRFLVQALKKRGFSGRITKEYEL